MRSAQNAIAVLREAGLTLSQLALDLDMTVHQLNRIARGEVMASPEMTVQLDRMARAVVGPMILPERHVPGVTRRYGR